MLTKYALANLDPPTVSKRVSENQRYINMLRSILLQDDGHTKGDPSSN
ncbi:hypothetical protein [Desertivirga brevis]|nr:hypothetical protein [Pedobacter sp. SYSU D00873]